MKKITVLGLGVAMITLIGCSSQPIIPTSDDITLTRKDLPDCENLGKLTGKTMNATGGKEEALEDIKEQAANKGATHIQIHQYSDMGTSVTGTLFKCQ
ncbi:hypothetical protein GW916_01420 [bacterium]|nr:hypothetical protein [bacterium]